MAKMVRSNNTEAFEKLEKEVERLLGVQKKILEQKSEAEEKARNAALTISKLEASLTAAYEKIKGYENMEAPAETMRKGYIEMATAPFAGLLPPPSKVGGVQVPRKIDAQGIAHEFLPVDNALRLMNDGSAFQRYLIGPPGVYKIEGEVESGMYRKKVSALRHKINVTKEGKAEFVLVELETAEIV